jgi:hypothetical protein
VLLVLSYVHFPEKFTRFWDINVVENSRSNEMSDALMITLLFELNT